mgnify:CR=1 FL=1
MTAGRDGPTLAFRRSLGRLHLLGLAGHRHYLVLGLPLLHLLDRDRLESLRPGALLVNVGRGSVVDERAVAGLLRSGHLGGFAADVFEFEDLSRPDRPAAIPEELIDMGDRTLFTPHLGSAVASARLRIEEHAARAILQALDGQVPDGAVNQPQRDVRISPRG